MRARGLSPQDVNAAIGAQNLILPAGHGKNRQFEYNVLLNASPSVLDELNDLPVRTEFGSTVYVRDVAHVRDGYAPQSNVVRVNGERAVLMAVQKTGVASTLDIISRVKDRLPLIRAGLPPELTVKAIGDQSVFVSAAVQGVIREGIIAAALTGVMILLFLGSWRSTLIITVSIPLSILASIVALSALGQTINVMTLAVSRWRSASWSTMRRWRSRISIGILNMGKAVEPAILDGAHQIAIPAPGIDAVYLHRVRADVFPERRCTIPVRALGEAVVFAMLASYVLSRTLVPTMAKFLLKPHDAHAAGQHAGNIFARFQAGFERRFAAARENYKVLLTAALSHRRIAALFFLVLTGGSMLLIPFLGEDFFPSVDGGEIKAACPDPCRHPHRRDGAAVRRSGSGGPAFHSGR